MGHERTQTGKTPATPLPIYEGGRRGGRRYEREREYTHDGGHVVLGARGDEHTEVRFAVVHA